MVMQISSLTAPKLTFFLVLVHVSVAGSAKFEGYSCVGKAARLKDEKAAFFSALWVAEGMSMMH